MDYKQGQLHTSKDGTQYKLIGDEWVPQGTAQPDSYRSDANKALSSVGLLAEGIAGIPQDVIRTGATLSAGANDLLHGQLPNWTAARERFSPENNPVVEYAGMPKKAIQSLTTGLGGDTGTSYLAEAGKAILDPIAQAVGPLSDASKTSLDVLGLGAAFYAPRVAVPPGMSGMATRVLEQGADMGAKVDPFLRKVAPRYTGVNQEIEAGMSAISQQAGKAVGLGDGVPLTAKGLATARETTKAGYDDLFIKLGDAGGVNVPVAGLVDDIKIALSDSGAISPIAQKAADKVIADFIPANATSLTAEELHKIQSAIGKQANDYRSAGKNVKADVLDTVHTSLLNRFTDELGTVYPTLVPELSKLRSQYHAQAVLNRAGVIGSEGNLNVPSLYRATRKVGNNEELVKLGSMAEGMKDMGGVKTGYGLMEQLTGKGLAAGVGSVFGGLPGAIAGAVLEPAVARLSSAGYVGMSNMAKRMRAVEATQTSTQWLSPNSGKFGQGGGVGRAVSADRQAAVADRAERAAAQKAAEAAKRPVGRPPKAVQAEDIGMRKTRGEFPEDYETATPYQKRVIDAWMNKNAAAIPTVLEQQTPQSMGLLSNKAMEAGRLRREGLNPPTTNEQFQKLTGKSATQLKNELKAAEDAAILRAKQEVAGLSSWNPDVVVEHTKAADRMLRSMKDKKPKKQPKDLLTEFVK